MSWPYSLETETRIQELYNCLPEISRYLYAVFEVSKLSQGGVGCIASLFDYSCNTEV